MKFPPGLRCFWLDVVCLTWSVTVTGLCDGPGLMPGLSFGIFIIGSWGWGARTGDLMGLHGAVCGSGWGILGGVRSCGPCAREKTLTTPPPFCGEVSDSIGRYTRY